MLVNIIGLVIVLYVASLMFSHYSDKYYYEKNGREWVEEGLSLMRDIYRQRAKMKECYWEEGSNCAPNEYFWPDGSVKKNYNGKCQFCQGKYWRNSSGHYASLSVAKRFEKSPGEMAPKG